MKPSVQELKKVCPEAPEELLRAHLERLDDNYYVVFGLPQICRHLQCLAALKSDHPVEVLFEEAQGGAIACTVLAYDYPAEFSMISGILSGMGFNILSGNIFTYRAAKADSSKNEEYRPVVRPSPVKNEALCGEMNGDGTRLRLEATTGKPTSSRNHRPGVRPAPRRNEGISGATQSSGIRRMIIDRFIGMVHSDLPMEAWQAKFSSSLGEVMTYLEKGGSEDFAAARRTVNELVAARLAGLKLQAEAVLYPVAIEIIDVPEYTRLKVISQDTPAFLYTFSSALALQNLSIEQIKISTEAGRIQDEIDILDRHGRKITDPARIDTIKISILLTKQFTYFLGISPDPYTALGRFDNLLQVVLAVPKREKWIKLLSTPEALQGLARLLGTSDYVWEDFVRLQYETLLPILNSGAGPKNNYTDGNLNVGRARPQAEPSEGSAHPAPFSEPNLTYRNFKKVGPDCQSGRLSEERRDKAIAPYRLEADKVVRCKAAGPLKAYATPPEDLDKKLGERLRDANGFEAQCRILNEFKNDELYLIDLEQILNPAVDVKTFSGQLTRLAELVVKKAAEIIFRNLQEKYGVPRTIAGFEAQWAILGLGKFGGAALGYASDIELLLVFSDNGKTDGPRGIENAEYFSAAARLLTEVITAKREGIFRVDIRLRPYGASGPFACSLESFCRYYGPNGKAHSYERLSLVRLRAVAGDAEFGGKIERLRDEFVYGASKIKFAELRDLREKQLAEKAAGGGYNAKFSPGALVDLEYDIQLLQVMHGRENARARTPRIHEALEELSALGVLGQDEGRRLAEAYYFLRRLINGLRMLRGSARDLFLPPAGSLEFAHLARRMGYRRGERLEPEQQLRVDFETQTAVVRAFIERHFGRDSLPGKPEGNVADLVLSGSVPPDLRERIMAPIGFKNPERAYLNLRKLASLATNQDLFAPLAVLVSDSLKQSVDPDRALNNWENYARAGADPAGANPARHYELLFSQPKRIEILMSIFAASQFLAETLIHNPDFMDWVTAPEVINLPRPRAAIESDLRNFTAGLNHDDWLNAIRRFRRREILRIGTRDICLHAPIHDVTADLSALADAMIGAVLEHFWVREEALGKIKDWKQLAGNFCILAFGKLGGRELNYSSDIDLLSFYDADFKPEGGNALGPGIYYRAIKETAAFLSAHTGEGHAYRVDFRLRPYGRAGQIVYSLAALEDYYRHKAALWEVQALLKARPVAGGEALGKRFQKLLVSIIEQKKGDKDIVSSIETMRAAAATEKPEEGVMVADIKNGSGGIRDIEFLVQGLQLVNLAGHPELINGNTLDVLTLLGITQLLPERVVLELKRDYEFLRRVEHCLQIFEDRQVHVLPGAPEEQEALAKRVLGCKATAADFLAAIKHCQARVRSNFTAFLTCR